VLQSRRFHDARPISEDLDMDRRDFLRVGLAGGAYALAPLLPADALARDRAIALIADPSDPVASAAPAKWALGELSRALSDAGAIVRRADALSQAGADDLCIMASGSQMPFAADALRRAGIALGDGPERLSLLTTRVSNRDVLLACGTDPRGVTYALLELADRVRTGGGPTGARRTSSPSPSPSPSSSSRATALSSSSLVQATPVVERPANVVRSVMRQFTSDVLDTSWFNDRDMWPRYLTMLATHRFNRLHLAFGLGYDTLQQVTDSYLLFLYPFLLAVPGYNVRATNLPDAERDRNLEMLRFISEETAARGLTFQLGIWMHGYELLNSPRARYIVEGLTPATHAAYCRDALTALLRACPAISAVALRIHGESGIVEGSYDFWQTVFDGVPRCGRSVEIDLHAKGVDQTMIDRALATGMPVNVSPKYWAEHLGMPYHQAAIRDLEMPAAGQTGRGLMTLSEGARSFTRYGYADLLRDDRQYTVRHRVFAGTQRILLSGDPAGTAAYSRMFQFCGSTGVDLMEPLTCRGRRGTGVPGERRSGYADASFEPRSDWEKYDYWYRVWGRLTYNPDAGETQWLRHFGPTANAEVNAAAADDAGADADARVLAACLARASRILPIVTTAHLPSAACDAYWPEIYWNQPMAGEPRPNPYGDTPSPKTFQHVSALDPQLFASIDEHAGELLTNERSGKYSPIEVAQWLEELAAGVTRDLVRIDRLASLSPRSSRNSPGSQRSMAVRRLAVDARIQAGLGRFFAAKFRAGVLYALHERTGDRRGLEEALNRYREARRAWAELSEQARAVYAADLSVSDKISERGQWLDRLPAIDEDIERLTQQLQRRASETPSASGSASVSASASPSSAAASGDQRIEAAIALALGDQRRQPAPCVHTPPPGCRPNVDLPIELTITAGGVVTSVQCHYRHVNQAERFQSMPMAAHDANASTGDSAGAVASVSTTYRATIPAAYTDSPYPLQYYFTLKTSPADASLYPGLGPGQMDQPYFVLRRLSSGPSLAIAPVRQP
jgi:hypothetical protein